MGLHGDRTTAAVSAWLSEDFSVGTGSQEEQVLQYVKLRNEDDGIDFSSSARCLAPMIKSTIVGRLEKSMGVW